MLLLVVALVAGYGFAPAVSQAAAIRPSPDERAVPNSDAETSVEGVRQGPIDPAELEAFLDGFFTERMKALDVPGVAFVLVKDGEIFLAKGYGYADLENDVPVDPKTTVFRIGSTSKLFTATAVMQLVEEGKIDLREDVNQYLERFQIPETYPEPVTMAHLLTHTAGFDEKLLGTFAESRGDVRPLGEYLAEEMPPRVMSPGEVTSYSNHGLALVGYIVETVSGMPFEEYVAQEILEPLRMERSSFAQPLPAELAADLAVPYPQALEAGPMLYTPIAPAGMLSTTAHDMARFLIAHLQNGQYGGARILDGETARLMHRRHFSNHPDIAGWAYGFTERTENGQRVLDHGGADPTGYGSMAGLLPDENLGFFVVSNTRFQDGLLMELPEAFLDHYYPEEDTPLEDLARLPGYQERLDRVNGTYLTNRYARHSVAKLSLLSQPPVRVQPAEEIPGLLVVTGLGEGTTRWVEVKPMVFQREGSEERIAFGEDGRGRITHLFARGHTPGAFDRAAWYQNPAFHQVLLGVCLLIFLTVVLGWPLVALIRRLSGRSRELIPAVRQARWLASGVSVLNVAFLVLAVILISTQPLQFGVPTEVKVLFILPLVTLVMTIGLPILGARAWGRSWSGLGRAQYVLVTVAAFAFSWFLNYWNLLGFRF
jgi:CubicO group peptidase (beta-lactamase class C family)